MYGKKTLAALLLSVPGIALGSANIISRKDMNVASMNRDRLNR
jgi:hypothetical protein